MNANKYNSDAQRYGIDTFSQILQLLKLDVSVYHNAKVCGDWRISEQHLNLTSFHVVMTGSVLIDVPDYFNGVLNSGDLVIFPRGLQHTMVSASPLIGTQQHLDYLAAQDMEGTGLLCGTARFQHSGSRFILDALPPVFIVRNNAGNYWLKPLLEVFLAESMSIGPASKVIFDKLAELFFTYAIRQHLMDHPDEIGMLSIYTHPRLAKAVEVVHKHPELAWTLGNMAKEAALSRTTFAETFKSVSGWTVGQYLTWWRMQLAWSLLHSGESMSEVAHQVGYKSDAAFSRAFQKMFHTTTGKVRRGTSE